jgi:putative membrane-bound dehydrogenase-like protein
MHTRCELLTSVLLIVFSAIRPVHADEAPPRALDDRIKIELFAEAPQIVTPTGIDVDPHGRVWAIESNTHFPPEGYAGHPTDRLLVFEGTTADNRAQRVTMFADGFTHAMSVACRPNGDIFVATRKEIVVLRDDNKDLKPDGPPRRIMFLDTPGDYPHNGLAGFAFDALGHMYFGCGENLGADYKLIAADGTSWSGGGEGGNIYRCRPDGTKLEHWATGFWNPHASCVDAFGNLFSVDNDPDSRPPCRLLHIVPGGDYGYRYRNGRRGTHPFTAWDGEIPGTLPMVAGTGEAPSGVLAYESDGLPDDYIGSLIATSWGDHRVDRFRVEFNRGPVRSRAEPIVVGGENFRPVGIALAPDGSVFCTDWVLKEYKLHGQGRIWRISAVNPPTRRVIDVTTVRDRPQELTALLASRRMDIRRAAAEALSQSEEGVRQLDAFADDESKDARARTECLFALTRLVAEGRYAPGDAAIEKFTHGQSPRPNDWTPEYEFEDRFTQILAYQHLHQALADHSLEELRSAKFDFHDPFDFRRGLQIVARFWDEPTFLSRLDAAAVPHAPTRLLVLLGARMKDSRLTSVVERGLRDPDPTVRFAAVQWVGEERLGQLRAQLEGILADGAVTTELFEAVLASLELLDGVVRKPTDEVPGSQYVLALLRDEAKPAAVRARALRMLPSSAKELDAALMTELLSSTDRGLKLEAVRTLQQSLLAEASSLLQNVAADESLAADLRAEAVLGLAPWASKNEEPNAARAMLLKLARDSQHAIRVESLRSLRALSDQHADVKAFLGEQRAELAPTGGLAALEKRELADQVDLALHSRVDSRTRPANADEWLNSLPTSGDRNAGSRVFFHSNSAGCYRCHTVNGRGGRVGPDLSTIARTMDRKKLAQSIVEPSREVAPQFVTWTLVTKEGKVHTGLILSESRDGKIVLGDAEGKALELSADDIEQRSPQKISLMPEKLVDQLSVGEFRDLLAFLESLK